MAAASALWLKCHSPRAIPRIVHRWLPHHPFMTTTKTRLLATRLFNHQRPFTSPSADLTSQKNPNPQPISGEAWENLSPEAKIQLSAPNKWGWVIYRCSYSATFDGIWNDFKLRIQRDLRESIIRESDAPGIAETMDFVFVEDPALENASVDELQSRFRAWAREDHVKGNANASDGLDLDDPQHWRCARHNFFLRVDGEGLCGAYVGLVHGWPVPLETTETETDDYAEEREDWMKINVGDIGPLAYDMLENEETFYTCYQPPEYGPVPYW